MKRSATEMEQADAEAGDISCAVLEHRRWLHAIRADYSARFSHASCASSDKEGSNTPRTSLVTRPSLDLDGDLPDDVDDVDDGAQFQPRHSCPDVGLCGWGKLADDFVDAFDEIRVCARGGETAAKACGGEPSGGSVQCIFAIEMVHEEWLNNKPPVLRRQHKIRRLSPKHLSTDP